MRNDLFHIQTIKNKALLNDSVDFHCERTLSAGRAPSLLEARLLRCLGCHASPAGVAALRSKQRDLQKSTLNDNTAFHLNENNHSFTVSVTFHLYETLSSAQDKKEVSNYPKNIAHFVKFLM